MHYRLLRRGLPDLLPMLHRSVGMHVSAVINDLCIRLGHYKSDSQPSLTRLQLGSALEHAIASRYAQDDPSRYLQPGEMVLDGLYGTADVLDCIDRVVEEIKLTWMSSRHVEDGTSLDSEKLWKYLVQLKAYCKMFRTSLGRLHICFLMGDYKSFTVDYYVWELTFTDEELEENWRMLLSHAAWMRANGINGEMEIDYAA